MQMPQEDLRKAQLLMLKILKEVHRVCEENNIALISSLRKCKKGCTTRMFYHISVQKNLGVFVSVIPAVSFFKNDFQKTRLLGNIKYFLSDGTLIGAVRHNGFIPWGAKMILAYKDVWACKHE